MVKITINEAKERLKNASVDLYATIIFYLRDDDVNARVYAYESHGAIIISQWYYNINYWWHLCDVGGSDMVAAAADVKNTFGNDILINQAYFLNDIPKDYYVDTNDTRTMIMLKFAGVGKPYNDSDIRLLMKNDREQIISLSAPNDDSDFAEKIENEATNLSADFDGDLRLLGIFDEVTLAGAVSVNVNNTELIRVMNIFVSRKYRGRGYATRLIRAAMALYTDTWYDYECLKSNLASAASAKAAGYTLAGTFIQRE